MKPCPNCNDLRYIQDAGFACCETCNHNNSFYDMKQSDTPETDSMTWDGHCGDGDWGKVVYAHWAQKLERERNERNEALFQIARILRDKETEHKDLTLESTAFKSVLSWAEKFEIK